MQSDVDPDTLDEAAAAIEAGELVVYPTETVYGLGADALDPGAVGRVFDAKRRSRDRPLSLAVPDVDAAFECGHQFVDDPFGRLDDIQLLGRR